MIFPPELSASRTRRLMILQISTIFRVMMKAKNVEYAINFIRTFALMTPRGFGIMRLFTKTKSNACSNNLSTGGCYEKQRSKCGYRKL